jgi:hypothetical protein
VLDSLFGIEWELDAAAVIDHGPSLSHRRDSQRTTDGGPPRVPLR